VRYYISELKNYVGQKIELKGWAYQTRSSGKVKFMELRDGTGIVPCVFFKGECDDQALELFDKITQETTVKLIGTVRKHPKHENVYEMGAQSIEILAPSENYPISPKDHGTDFLMENRHLWLRSKRQHAIMRLRHEIIYAIRDFF
jgi:asparaginyl-tRNA synthetase